MLKTIALSKTLKTFVCIFMYVIHEKRQDKTTVSIDVYYLILTLETSRGTWWGLLRKFLEGIFLGEISLGRNKGNLPPK